MSKTKQISPAVMAERSRGIDWRRFATDAVDLMCVASFDGYFHWLNGRWEEVLGRTIEELMAVPLVAYLHPDDLERTNAELEKIKSGARVLRFVNRYFHKDGSIRWLEWTARPKVEEGLSYGSARDVTEVRTQLIAAQSQLESLRLAEEAGSVGRWRVDIADNKLTWSPEVFRIHGLEPNSVEVQVEDAINFYHPDDRELVNATLGEMVEKREPRSFEGARIVRPDGTVRWVTAHGQVEVDPVTDEVTAMFGVFVDTTESRALRERVARAERLASLGTMAAGVAHEINNPLSLILSNAHLIAEGLGGRRPVETWGESYDLRELTDEIDDAARRIANIVVGLKSFARGSEPRVAPVKLPAVIEAATRLCRNEVRHKAELRVESGDVPKVRADEAKLSQVAVNLIVNAAQAMPADSARKHSITVRFGVESRGGDSFGYFEVEDDGQGMPAEVLEQSFTPFFTTKPPGVGTGLGLAICHGIVSQLGGHLDARSTPGKGTTMRVSLPVASPAEQAPSDRFVAPSPNEQIRARVLVIDDDRPVGRATARLLQGHDVELETDPHEAVRRLQAGERFDVVVCDLMMPDLSGPKVYRAIERDRPELVPRVLFVTGGAFATESLEFLEATRVRVLEKPLDPFDLRRAVMSVLQHR